MQVSCDMVRDKGGWTVFQRREDGSVDFERDFGNYTVGFGNASGEYWMGLENLHMFTYGRKYTLRIDMMDFNGVDAYATYQEFSVGEGDLYVLDFEKIHAPHRYDGLQRSRRICDVPRVF